MAANDITYGTRTALANVTRLHSIADGVGVAFGEITGGGEIGNNIHLAIPINASATSGTYDVYLCESQDGAEWTDGIDPATAGDQSAKLSDLTFISSSSTIYNASNRSEARINVQIAMLSSAKSIGIFVVNNSGQTVPASGADGDSVAYTIASA
jgi:hypothetical protein